LVAGCSIIIDDFLGLVSRFMGLSNMSIWTLINILCYDISEKETNFNCASQIDAGKKGGLKDVLLHSAKTHLEDSVL
jgi:hypothetical protein